MLDRRNGRGIYPRRGCFQGQTWWRRRSLGEVSEFQKGLPDGRAGILERRGSRVQTQVPFPWGYCPVVGPERLAGHPRGNHDNPSTRGGTRCPPPPRLKASSFRNHNNARFRHAKALSVPFQIDADLLSFGNLDPLVDDGPLDDCPG